MEQVDQAAIWFDRHIRRDWLDKHDAALRFDSVILRGHANLENSCKILQMSCATCSGLKGFGQTTRTCWLCVRTATAGRGPVAGEPSPGLLAAYRDHHHKAKTPSPFPSLAKWVQGASTDPGPMAKAKYGYLPGKPATARTDAFPNFGSAADLFTAYAVNQGVFLANLKPRYIYIYIYIYLTGICT